MSTAGGPRITSQDNLVLCLDAHDAKSYPGEPTNNTQPNDVSSRFASGNSWGTYQVNQYNGNAYFSIGTVSSVSGNVVTTSSNHPFRTFDAVRAQTSGGGINAGTDYLIKKLSNTTFTIHAYNNSQDGTQGYIRSDGYHQVHASIATDTRISINATSFPTMWWGAPHLPNTAHVKELRIGGGPKRGTNALRIHVTRTVGVDGGMSYGVYPAGTTQGDTVTTSWWARSSLPTKPVTYYTYWGTGAANSTSFTPTLKWQKFTHSWTASATYSFYQYWFQGADSAPWWFELADIQTELNKSYSTPYVLPATDRSTTDAWKDRKDSNNLTFNGGVNTGVSHYRKGQVIEPKSNAYISFDGTDDYLEKAQGFQIGNTRQKTVEAWVKDWTSGTIVSMTDHNNNYKWQQHGIGSSQLMTGSGYGTRYHFVSGYTASGWHHWVDVCDEDLTATNRVKRYIDGVLISSNSQSTDDGSSFYDGTDLYLHVGAMNYGSGAADFFNGEISVVRIYNAALSQNQAKANFNAQRGRYGI